jgi:hypothetical protein
MLIRKLLLVSLILAGGLATSACTPKLVAVKTNPCAGWSAIYPSKQDVLTDGTAKQILAHDEHGVASGCWKAPQKTKTP